MIQLSEILLRDLYYNNKLTRQQIAIKLKTSLSTIKRCFKRYNVHKISKQPLCIDCGDDCEQVGEDISTAGAYGDIYTVRELLNELRDIVEEEQEEGFINV